MSAARADRSPAVGSDLGTGVPREPDRAPEPVPDRAPGPAAVGALAIRLAALSVTGPVRSANEDHVAWLDADGVELGGTPDERVLVRQLGGRVVGVSVADGLGGHGRGDQASRTASRIVLSHLAPLARRPGLGDLRDAMSIANGALLAGELDGSTELRPGPQTTMTALVFAEDSVHIGHIGDTRLYRLRDEVVDLLTQDHTQVAELVRMRVIKPHQAANHPGRHLLTRSMGGEPVLRADTVTRMVQPGDIYAICSDGCWGAVTPGEIREAMEGDLAVGARHLVDRAIEAYGDDNASVILISVDALAGAAANSQPNRPFWRRVFGS
jgi:serine/threonine protein phosphatase PrpC